MARRRAKVIEDHAREGKGRLKRPKTGSERCKEKDMVHINFFITRKQRDTLKRLAREQNMTLKTWMLSLLL